MRLGNKVLIVTVSMFQFTHPVWGATLLIYAREVISVFQFTHPVWGATDAERLLRLFHAVSIHAPRVGCDCWKLEWLFP